MATARKTEADFNQSPAFTEVNLFTSDTALREAVAREGGSDAADNLAAFGRIAGSAAAAELGRQANENPPGFAPSMHRGGGSIVSTTTLPITG